MKGLLAIVALAFYACQSSASAVVGRNVQARARPDCANPKDAVTLLRGVRPNSQAHAYSTNATAMERWIALNKGRSEGDAARVFTSQEGSTVPVYQAANPAGPYDNVYTTDSNEIVTLVAQGWYNIGITWYAYTSQICDSVPFYVVDNPDLTDHIYTTNITERDALVSSENYVDEGIAMYVLPFTG